MPARAPGAVQPRARDRAVHDPQARARLDRVALRDGLRRARRAGALGQRVAEDPAAGWDAERLRGEILKLEADMSRTAAELRFEEAARLRDRLRELERLELAR